MGELTLMELDVQGTQDNWKSFPIASWTNNLGYDISLKIIYMQLVGADQLVGELAMWLIHGSAWPPPATSLFASFGAELYTNPNQPVIKSVDFGDHQITVKNGSAISLVTNAGPLNLPGGGQSPPLTYVASAQLYYLASRSADVPPGNQKASS
jgi:hypothetical protein